MATVQWVVLRHHKKKDGTYNPKLLITQNGKEAFIPTGMFTKMVRFRKGSARGNITDTIALEALNKKVAQIRSIIIEKDEVVSSMTATEIKEYVLKRMAASEEIDFLVFAETYIATIKNPGTRFYHESRLRTLSAFVESTCGERKLLVKRITTKFIEDYEEWLRTSKRRRGEGYGLSESTINTHITAVSTIFNAAKRKYNNYNTGDIVIKNDPFMDYNMPEKDEVKKRALPPADIRRIYDYSPTNKSAELARDVFLLSFFLAGMNVADMWECQPFTDRIEYTRKKTRSHKKDAPFLSLPIHPRISPIVEKYADIKGMRGFGFYNSYSKIGSLHQCIHYGMLRMREDLGLEGLTFYAARHSFATIARNDCGVSMDDIALCLTHDSGHSMTDTYIKKDYSRIDNVIDKVVQFVFGE